MRRKTKPKSKSSKVVSIRKPTKFDEVVAILKKSARSTVKPLTTLEYHRTDTKDLYTFFTKKQLNQKIRQLQKQNPDKVLLAEVTTTLGTRNKKVIHSQKFKVTHLSATKFQSGKRKGRRWTASDITSYFIHQSASSEDYRLYKKKTETDGVRVVHGKQGNKYRKAQTFQIKISTAPKDFSKSLPRIEQQFVRFRRNRRKAFAAKHATRTKVSRVSGKRKPHKK